MSEEASSRSERTPERTGWWRRFRTPVPPEVRALGRDERRLAWGVTTGGEPVVATATSLHVGDRVLAWTQVEKVAWRPPMLVVTEVSEVEGAGAQQSVELAQDQHLAETVRERVTASVGWTDVRRLAPRGKVRLVGRRVPGQDALLWQVVYLQGTDPHDPDLRAQAEALVGAVRGTIG